MVLVRGGIARGPGPGELGGPVHEVTVHGALVEPAREDLHVRLAQRPAEGLPGEGQDVVHAFHHPRVAAVDLHVEELQALRVVGDVDRQPPAVGVQGRLGLAVQVVAEGQGEALGVQDPQRLRVGHARVLGGDDPVEARDVLAADQVGVQTQGHVLDQFLLQVAELLEGRVAPLDLDELELCEVPRVDLPLLAQALALAVDGVEPARDHLLEVELAGLARKGQAAEVVEAEHGVHDLAAAGGGRQLGHGDLHEAAFLQEGAHAVDHGVVHLETPQHGRRLGGRPEKGGKTGGEGIGHVLVHGILLLALTGAN